MSKLIHYSDPMSRGMRTQALLEYYDIPHESVLVELRKGGHKEPGYDKIHPYRRVPALQDGDFTLVESGAITLYLADKFADKMNTPAVGTPERGRFYEWMFFLQTTLEAEAMKGFNPDTKEEGKTNIRALLQSMASHFKGPFVLGDRQTVIDVVLRTELSWYQMMGLFPEGLEPYDSFMKRVSAQSATK